MQILTGIATASGVSSLLNAPRDTGTEARTTLGDSVRADLNRRKDTEQRVITRKESARPVDGPEVLDRSAELAARKPPATPEEATQRREQFIEALSIVRGEPSDDTPPPARRDSASGTDGQPEPALKRRGPPTEGSLAATFFDDGIPTPVEPETVVAAPAQDAEPTLADDGIPQAPEPLEAPAAEARADAAAPEGETAFADDGAPQPGQPLDGPAAEAPVTAAAPGSETTLAEDGIPQQPEPLAASGADVPEAPVTAAGAPAQPAETPLETPEAA